MIDVFHLRYDVQTRTPRMLHLAAELSWCKEEARSPVPMALPIRCKLELAAGHLLLLMMGRVKRRIVHPRPVCV
jgi:hypothetical protein